ncbi:hypothetical protein CA54_45700 [Symmachiella macrocystis]|uniref:Uncharacterized protein n=1 Tax=Symmachiella macrocystis TaxID=2527985 RepID=A0A5C6BDH1_9PLAN|nr:hypothetical protein CA54_45700 [Symmachiella macrocystis]
MYRSCPILRTTTEQEKWNWPSFSLGALQGEPVLLKKAGELVKIPVSPLFNRRDEILDCLSTVSK